ncbi:MAG: glutaredoxin family protein [Abitibacteriaceae bacterium]|nr:glutaredoxin family protein [Abditibacteriaceae bacterium]
MAQFHVRLYSRPDCSVCEQAAALLEGLHSDFDFQVENVNIEEDPALKERLANQVPVITINGGNRVATDINEERLRRAFKRALQPPTPAKSDH